MATNDKNRRELHPAVSISSWLVFALTVELATPAHLPWLALPAVLLLSGKGAWRRFARLAWKGRWLWLALVFLYAWTVPGMLLWPSDFSPTLEGLYAGLVRVARLLLLLAALARLLCEFTPLQLAGGIYLLAKPFARLGLDCRALAVRLALTLDRLERPVQARNWRQALSHPAETEPAGPDEIRLSIGEAGPKDGLLLAAALLAATLVQIAG